MVREQRTPLVGSSETKSGSTFELKCTPGNFITAFSGDAAASGVVAIAAACSDGSKLGAAKAAAGQPRHAGSSRAAAAGGEPGAFSYRSSTGFASINAHAAGTGIDAVSFTAVGKAAASPVFGKRMVASALSAAAACKGGQRMVGVFGQSSTQGLLSVGAICADRPQGGECRCCHVTACMLTMQHSCTSAACVRCLQRL